MLDILVIIFPFYVYTQWTNPLDFFGDGKNFFENAFPQQFPFFSPSTPCEPKPQPCQPKSEDCVKQLPKNQTVEESQNTEPIPTPKPIATKDLPQCLKVDDNDSFEAFRKKYPRVVKRREVVEYEDYTPPKLRRHASRGYFPNTRRNYDTVRLRDTASFRTPSRYVSKTTPFYSALLSSPSFPSTPALGEKEQRLQEKRTSTRLSCMHDCADEFDYCLDLVRSKEEKPLRASPLQAHHLPEAKSSADDVHPTSTEPAAVSVPSPQTSPSSSFPSTSQASTPLDNKLTTRADCRRGQRTCLRECDLRDAAAGEETCGMMKSSAEKACEDQYDDRMTLDQLYVRAAPERDAERERRERRDLRRCLATVAEAHEECLMGSKRVES